MSEDEALKITVPKGSLSILHYGVNDPNVVTLPLALVLAALGANGYVVVPRDGALVRGPNVSVDNRTGVNPPWA